MNYKNIIFDLGGVILDIDYKRTIEAFRRLGIPNPEELYSKKSQINLFDELEIGRISEIDFYSGIRKLSESSVTDNQIREAWNAILIGLPDENVNLLFDLKKNHRLFLLSNTNIIHERAYREMITAQYGRFIFDDIFEKMYLSHHIHLRKPDVEIFKYVLKDAGINANETCFIDDSPQHVEGAEKADIKAYHLNSAGIVAFFREKN